MPGSFPRKLFFMHNHEVWIKFAQDDLKAAHYFFQVCPQGGLTFHCQQAAEKILKAYLVLQDYTFKKTCDLPKLIRLCARFDREFESLTNAAIALNPLTVRYVYPTEYGQATMAIMQEALDHANSVMAFVLKKIKEKEETQKN